MISTRPLPPNDHYPLPGYADPFRPAVSRHAGTDDTLAGVDAAPGAMGTEGGYMGRDVTASPQPYNEGQGMFRRLHEGG